MNPTRHAVALGLRRGWTEFVLSLRSAQDQGFYLFMALGTLTYLWLNRDTEVEGTDLLLPDGRAAEPARRTAGVRRGDRPAYALAMEREDGTLLRHKAVPHGMRGYVTGQLRLHSLGLVPLLLVILVPSFLLFDDVMSNGPSGWVTVAWVVVLGLLATLPIGMVIGSLRPERPEGRHLGDAPGADPHRRSRASSRRSRRCGAGCRCVAQIFPTYWIGLGMRSAFLPDAAAAAEIGGSWRTGRRSLRPRGLGGRSACWSRPGCCAGWLAGSRARRCRRPGKRRPSGSR